MNLKETAKRMSKKRTYRWIISPTGQYHLFGEGGHTIIVTGGRYEAEIVTRKLRGMGMQIPGDVPARMNY